MSISKETDSNSPKAETHVRREGESIIDSLLWEASSGNLKDHEFTQEEKDALEEAFRASPNCRDVPASEFNPRSFIPVGRKDRSKDE